MSKTKKNSDSSEEFSSTSCTSSSLSSDEEVDVRDLKPIKDYLCNRRELARQLFKSVKPEKIRMMLPQVLKKMDLNELEEWCASELSGMSKTRILCILNGKVMLESSDTSESDDSGPSLEIISDTEEWLTDDDDNIKKEQGIVRKFKTKKHKNINKIKSQNHDKKDDLGKTKLKTKINQKEGNNHKYKNVEVKQEDEKEMGKEKEADSLLDLLELEMRARAIRALIRKEDDIIPNSSEPKTSKTTNSVKNSQHHKSTEEDINAKENCRRQLEKIISAKQGAGDEEDVVLVVQPTPTIELLSSDSENEENENRVNKKLENERTSEKDQSMNNLEEKTTVNTNNTNSTLIDRENKSKIEESGIVKQNDVIKETSYSCNLKKDNILIIDTKMTTDVAKNRKTKKKLRVKDNNMSEQSAEMDVDDGKKDTKGMKETEETVEKVISKAEKEFSSTVFQSKEKSLVEEDKSGDQEEVIDLDNYSDDIEDMENYDNNKSKNKNNNFNEHKNQAQSVMDAETQKPKSTETWVTRYYQTDDVQNVIKESKIQSEIRKRLRERQRLSKLNNSPNSSSSSKCAVPQPAVDKSDQKPTGSVKEYLALKQVTLSNLNTNYNNDGDINIEEKDKCADTCVTIITSNNETSITTINKTDKDKLTVSNKQEDT